MTKERRRFLKAILREGLFSVLQPVCRNCGTVEDLTFDLIRAGGDKHHRFNGYDRILFYWSQHTNFGNVQVLCHSCNSAKKAGEMEIADRSGLCVQVADNGDPDWRV